MVDDGHTRRIKRLENTTSVDLSIQPAAGADSEVEQLIDQRIDALYMKDLNTGSRFVAMLASNLVNGDFVTIMD